MFGVVADDPRGLMFVRVHKNEGQTTGYSGLHNWNFDTDENHNFILWRDSEKYNIKEDLSDFVEGQAAEMHVDEDPEIFFVGYRKAS